MRKLRKDGTLERRGGKRANSPPPPKQWKNYSEEIKKAVSKGCVVLERLTGKNLGTVICEIAWGYEIVDGKAIGIEIQDSVKLAAQRLIADILVVKESKQTVETVKKPTIYTPDYKQEEAGPAEKMLN